MNFKSPRAPNPFRIEKLNTINGTIDVYNQCFASNNCIALDNFWRSLSNLTINVTGGTGCQAATDFWAVSQAAPMRRVQVNGKLRGTITVPTGQAGPQNLAIAKDTVSGALVGMTIVKEIYVPDRIVNFVVKP